MDSEMPLPIPVKRALRRLGNRIRTARIRRRITMALMASRAAISRTTLSKVEKGDSSVSFGTYATVIFILGMVSNLEGLLDTSKDTVGMDLEEASLPKRVYHPRSRSKDVSRE